MNSNKKHILLQLFLSSLSLSAFTFGGGYVIITLMKKKFVDEYHWIQEKEMLDLIAIAQSSPGAIAVNGAIVIGYKLAGIAGAAAAISGAVLPPFFIILIVSTFYKAFSSNRILALALQGMQAGVAAVIASVVYEMTAGIVSTRQISSILILIISFLASCVFHIPVIYIILVCVGIGLLRRDCKV